MRKQRLAVILFSCSLLALGGAGCGGSNSSSAHPSTTLISEQNGYTWNYAISGEATPTAGGSPETVSGTATATITNANVNGSTLELDLATSINLNGGATSYPLDVIYYVQQDSNGNIIEYASSNTDSSGTTTYDVTSPSLANSEIFPGTFSQGETINETIDFNGGSSHTYDLEVVQPAEVSTTAGSFATWQVNLVLAGVPIGTQYWDPALGMFVKGTVNSQANLGGTQYNMVINYSLTGTSGGVP